MESIDPAIAGKSTPLGVARRIAGPQHGVVARRQLIRAGLSSSAIEHMLAAGRLLPLYRAVYAVGHRPAGPRSRDMAVVLLAGDTGALARQSSQAMGDDSPLARPGARDRPEVAQRSGLRHPPHARPATRGPHPPLGHPRHHAPAHAPRPQPAHSPSMPWTPRSPRRSCASSCGSRTSRPAPRGRLREAARHGRPDHARGSSATCASILHEHGLPQPISNGFVCGYEVDLHWPQHRLIAELDGWLYHGHQRAFETDRERDLVLATHGWRTVRLTAAQLDRARDRRRAVRPAAQQPRTVTLPRLAVRNQIGVPTASVTWPSWTRRP